MADARWFLTGQLPEADAIQAVDIDCSPFQIGRRPDLSLTLPSAAVSSLHAEILIDNGSLQIKDCNSTNGTFRNGTRIVEATQLEPGDLLQFADVPMRINQEPVASSEQEEQPTDEAEVRELPLSDFDQFLRMRTVIPHFQPIVALQDRALVGYEVLARSRVDGLRTPDEMFLAASQLNLEEQLSRVLRLVGFEKGVALREVPCLFINTHAAEIATFGLLDSLQRLRHVNVEQPITLEIPEPAATETNAILQLRETLKTLNMRLAYDHYGAGQTGRAELAAVRPDYVKLDMNLIREIHLAPTAQKTLLTNLVNMVKDLGIVPVAVGVECESEHDTCQDLGFELGQGYFYGKPSTREDVTASQPSEPGYV